MPEITRERIEARVSQAFQRYFSPEDTVSCHAFDSAHVSALIKYRWSLEVELQSRSLTGKRNIGTRLDSKDKVIEASRQLIHQIQAGGHQTHNRSLLNYVTGYDKARAVWVDKKSLGQDERIFSHITTCDTCNGHGNYSCTGCGGSGYTTCHFCHGSNQISCGSCGGSGRFHSGNQVLNCSACFGSGRTNCYHCYFHGYDTCVRCGGDGLEDCRPCDATGYFTHKVSFAIYGKRHAALYWEADNTAPWINDYLRGSLRGQFPWLPLHTTIRIDPDTICRDETIDYPITMQAAGILPACKAEISQGTTQTSCELFGEGLDPLTLGHIGESSAERLARELPRKADTPGTLSALLGLGLFDTLLAMRKNKTIDFTSLYPVIIDLISAASAEKLLDAYRATVNDFKKRRAKVGLASWLAHSVPWSIILFILIGIPNALFPTQLDWTQSGILGVENSVQHLLSGLEAIADFDESAIIAFCISGTIVLALARLYFTVPRERAAWRHLLDFVACSLLGMFLLIGLFPARQDSASALTPHTPGLNEIVTASVLSLQMLPEILLLGLTLGLLHSRRKQDLRAKNQVDQIAIPALAEDLGYQFEPQQQVSGR